MLGGGITNHNLRARYGGRDLVVRLAGKDTALLGIDRDCERDATAAAAAAGIGPEVVTFLREPACLVTAFIAGRTLERRTLARAGRDRRGRGRAAGGPRRPAAPQRASTCPRLVDPYARTARRARRRARRAPSATLRARARRDPRRARPAHPEHAPVPCHNDLLAANFIHDGERLRIVDWEYAGMGDRYFDLGNLSVNNGFNEADDERAARVPTGASPARGGASPRCG